MKLALAFCRCTLTLLLFALPARAASTHLPDEQHAPPQVKEKLRKLRQQFSDKKYRFKIGYTSKSHLELKQITGLKLPPKEEIVRLAHEANARAKEWLAHHHKHRAAHPPAMPHEGSPPSGAGNDGDAVPDPTPVPDCANQAHYDLRKAHLVTAIRDQGTCGACWDFSALAAFESSFAINNGQVIDTSEQEMIDCNTKHAGCGGGWPQYALIDLQDKGVTGESDVPYHGREFACETKAPARYFAAAWGYVQADAGIPTVQEMKAAICEHGAISVTLIASDAFHNYVGGVFNEEHALGFVNHAVSIIGWDEPNKAWLLKNQWGTAWGEDGGDPSATRGYMWIAYGTNLVGYLASWVEARSRQECDVRVMSPAPTPRNPNPEPFNSTQLFMSSGECQHYAQEKCAMGAADYRFTVEADWTPACK